MMMQLRISLAIIMGFLTLLLFGCGVDEPDGPVGPSLGTIIGIVLDENGRPVSGATVTTEPETSQVITGSDGSYKIPAVADGSYTVWARTSDKEGKAPVAVKGGETKADIRLEEILPEVTITEGPAEDSTIQERDVTFVWTGRNVKDYSYKMNNDAWSEWGTGTSKTYLNLDLGKQYTFIVKARDNKGRETEDTRIFTIEKPTPITIEITFPKTNDKVDWRTRITGKLLGPKDLKDLKAKLKLNPDDELKISLWVWDPNDPHGPWPQPSATIKNNLEWVEDEPAWFGRQGVDVGINFNVKAELVKKKGDELIPIEKVDSVTITDVIRK